MRPSQMVDLGELTAEWTRLKLRLQLASSLHIAPSEEDDVDLESLLNPPEISRTALSKPWILPGMNYRLTLRLDVDECLQERLDPEFYQTLTLALKQAKLWSQLDMEVTSSEIVGGLASSIRLITFTLAPLDSSHRDARGLLRKLRRDVPLQDIKPPVDFPCLTVEKTLVSIKLANLERRIQSLARNDSGAVSQNIAKSRSETFVGLEDSFTAPSGRSSPLDCDAMMLESYGEVAEDSEMLGLDVDEESSMDCSPIESYNEATTTVSPAHFTNDLTNNCTYDEKVREKLMQAVDVGFRMAISGPPQRRSKTLMLTYNESFHTLAAVAPTLWSPGYLFAVCSRAILIPTISQALAKAGGTGNIEKDGPSDRELSTQLQPDEPTSKEVEQTATIARDKATLIQLWAYLQSTLYDAKAAGRLRPLDVKVAMRSNPYFAESSNTGTETLLDQTEDNGAAYLFEPDGAMIMGMEPGSFHESRFAAACGEDRLMLSLDDGESLDERWCDSADGHIESTSRLWRGGSRARAIVAGACPAQHTRESSTEMLFDQPSHRGTSTISESASASDGSEILSVYDGDGDALRSITLNDYAGGFEEEEYHAAFIDGGTCNVN